MSVDGAGFHVEVEALERASKDMREAVGDDEHHFQLRDLAGGAAMYGHARVYTAFTEFCERWNTGLETLSDRQRWMERSLNEAAKAYREADRAAGDALRHDPGIDALDRRNEPLVPPGGGMSR